jgi:apolipoprotein N-acyltransferase
VLKGDIQGYAGATPYVLWGNLPVLIGCFGLLGFAVIRCRFRRRP